MSAVSAQTNDTPAADRDAAPVLKATDLHRHYAVSRGMLRGHATLRAVAGASFVLNPGRTLAVVGESGCGKSTLARMVTMIERPTALPIMVASASGEFFTRPGNCAARVASSRSTASVYRRCGITASAREAKSQYGHFERQYGKWM